MSSINKYVEIPKWKRDILNKKSKRNRIKVLRNQHKKSKRIKSKVSKVITVEKIKTNVENLIDHYELLITK